MRRNKRNTEKENLTNTNTATSNPLLTELQNARSLLQINQDNLENIINTLNEKNHLKKTRILKIIMITIK